MLFDAKLDLFSALCLSSRIYHLSFYLNPPTAPSFVMPLSLWRLRLIFPPSFVCLPLLCNAFYLFRFWVYCPNRGPILPTSLRIVSCQRGNTANLLVRCGGIGGLVRWRQGNRQHDTNRSQLGKDRRAERTSYSPLQLKLVN